MDNRKFFRPKGDFLLYLFLFSLILIVFVVNVNHFKEQDTKITKGNDSSNASGEKEINNILRQNSFKVIVGNITRQVVIITIATHQYLELLQNLRCSIGINAKKNLVVFSLDKKLQMKAKKLGMSSILAPYSEQKESEKSIPLDFGTTEFNSLTKLKFSTVLMALKTGIDVLFTDVDVVWCDDASERIVESIVRDPKADMFIQNEKTKDDVWPLEPNTGFFYAKSLPHVIQMFEFLVMISDKGVFKNTCDQGMFNMAICTGNLSGRSFNYSKLEKTPAYCEWNEKVIVRLLPLLRFPNGLRPLNTWIYEMPTEKLRNACKKRKMAIFHNNWCTQKDKAARLNKFKLWNVDRKTMKCKKM